MRKGKLLIATCGRLVYSNQKTTQPSPPFVKRKKRRTDIPVCPFCSITMIACVKRETKSYHLPFDISHLSLTSRRKSLGCQNRVVQPLKHRKISDFSICCNARWHQMKNEKCQMVNDKSAFLFQ